MVFYFFKLEIMSVIDVKRGCVMSDYMVSTNFLRKYEKNCRTIKLKDKGGNHYCQLFFEGNKLYSYGKHFLLAEIKRNKLYINIAPTSKTTTSQRNYLDWKNSIMVPTMKCIHLINMNEQLTLEYYENLLNENFNKIINSFNRISRWDYYSMMHNYYLDKIMELKKWFPKLKIKNKFFKNEEIINDMLKSNDVEMFKLGITLWKTKIN